jgi:probable phosphoglycerate mutase
MLGEEKTRLVLVRHGETAHNAEQRLAGWTDTPLSAAGLRQAEALASRLAAEVRPDALYTSPLLRARRTADAIAARTGLTPCVVDDLREWHLGQCEGLTNAEVKARFPGLLAAGRDRADLTWGWPGGERRSRFYDRAVRAVAGIAAAHPGETIVVVAHNAVLSSYLARAVDGDAAAWPAYVLANCALAEVLVRGDRAHVVRCNVPVEPR